jgi:putative flippase GtrA
MTELNYPATGASGTIASPVVSGPVPSRLVALFLRFRQLITFGVIGGVTFVIDVGLYNLLRSSVMSHQPITAKVVSVVIATIIAYIGNRSLTFREARAHSMLREGILFAAANAVGLLISLGCLAVSHYLLGYTSQLADNVAGNGVGLVLGTTFRFVAYRYFVFTKESDIRVV